MSRNTIYCDSNNRRLELHCPRGHVFYVSHLMDYGECATALCPVCEAEKGPPGDFGQMMEYCRQTEMVFQSLREHERTCQEKWDRDFLAMAEWYARRKSKDPSTQTGAVITRGREVVSMGYNGFARGVKDLPERYADRELKYRMIVHAERNSLLFARQDITGCTLYTWPFQPCAVCAGMIINAGITRCVAPVCPPDKLERWKADFELTELMFKEADVRLDLLEVEQK